MERVTRPHGRPHGGRVQTAGGQGQLQNRRATRGRAATARPGAHRRQENKRALAAPKTPRERTTGTHGRWSRRSAASIAAVQDRRSDAPSCTYSWNEAAVAQSPAAWTRKVSAQDCTEYVAPPQAA